MSWRIFSSDKRALSVAALLIIVVAAAYLWWIVGANLNRGVDVGENAAGISFNGLDGETFSLSRHRGEVVILEFMTTWCGVCKLQFQELKALHDKLPDVFMASIEIDPTLGEEAFESWASSEGYDWFVGHSPQAGRTYKVSGVPTLIFVDKEGVIQYRGHYTSADQLELLVQQNQ